MEFKGINDKSIFLIFLLKSLRVFLFGYMSIILPNYLLVVGFNSFYAGLIITISIIFSSLMNIFTAKYGGDKNIYKILISFSIFIILSGLFLFSYNKYLIILGSIIGMISTTGTETGPFLSIEQALIPKFVKSEFSTFYYSIYNILGYLFSVFGDFSVYLVNINYIRYYFLFYSIMGFIFVIVYTIIKDHLYYKSNIKSAVKNDTKKIAFITGILFSIDSFAGGFILQSILALWLKHFFDVNVSNQGLILGTGGIITVISLYITPYIASRYGLLNTMVFSHLISNVFLILIVFVNSLFYVILLLYLRQAFSQMDVPTRQSFFMKIIDENDRTYFTSFTNMPRGFAQAGSPWLAGLIISLNVLYLPFLIAGTLKISYDLIIYKIFANYKDIK
jgi:MFS family permease